MIHFDISALKQEFEELEKQTMANGFWNDQDNSNKVLAKIKSLKFKCSKYQYLNDEAKNTLELIDLVQMEYDEELTQEIVTNINNLKKELEKFEIQTLLSGKYDSNSAILTIHPGAGGTESQDWAEMLYRMYSRWASKNEYEIKELDFLEGDEAGIKSVTFEVDGENAYGYLKGEMGVHRLVRISPFDAGRKKTYIFCIS